jgi:hypothetical protein
MQECNKIEADLGGLLTVVPLQHRYLGAGMQTGRLKPNDVLKLYEKLVLFLFWPAFEGNETCPLWMGKDFIFFLVDLVAEDAASYNLCNLISGFQKMVEHSNSTTCRSFNPQKIIDYIDSGGLSQYITQDDGVNSIDQDSDLQTKFETLLCDVHKRLHWDNLEFRASRDEDFQSQYTYVGGNVIPKLLELKYKQHRLAVDGSSGCSSSQGQPQDLTNFLKLLTTVNVTHDQLALHNGLGV